jgi:hypothetical protein
MKLALFCPAASLACMLVSGSARADESAATDVSPHDGVDAAHQERPTHSLPHRHDGFYLRLATGFGPYNESIGLPHEMAHTSVSGIASTGEFAVGGSLRPGFIVGGAIWSTTVLASDTRTDPGAIVPPSTQESGSFSVIGPWFDYYFDPRGGLHLPASVGLAVVRGIDAQGASLHRDDVAFGAGILAGIGYEWWVSDEWSVGITGRLTGIVATSKESDGNRWMHLIGSSPSVLFTVTYN